MADTQDKPKRRGRKVKFILALVILSLIIIFFDYTFYEYRKFHIAGAKPFTDWRSYIAYRLGRIPFVSKYIEYEPLEAQPSESFYVEKLEAVLKGLEEKRAELEKMRQEIESERARLETLKAQLEVKEKELQQKEKSLNEAIAKWNDWNEKMKKLADWIASADPQQIAPALAATDVSVKLLGDTLRLLSSDVAAEVLQSLTSIDPQKAARVISSMGSGTP